MSKIRYIVWILSGKCNLNCIHCYASRFRNIPELPLSRKLTLIREFAELNIKHVSLSGGELTIHKELPIILQELHNYGIEVSIVTNATHLSDEIVRIFRKTETYVYVSVDGNKYTHELIRGLGTWNKMIEGIELLKKYGVEFGTVMALSKINYKAIPEYLEFSIKQNSNLINFIPIMPTGNARFRKDIILEANNIPEIINILDEKCCELGIDVVFWCTPFIKYLSKSKYIHSGNCRNGLILDIDPSGRILLCDILDIVISNVKENSLKNALQEVLENEFIKKLILKPGIPNECESCPYSKYCFGGCFARSYLMYNDLFRKDPLCPLKFN